MAMGLCNGNTWTKVGYKTGKYVLKESSKYFARESGKTLSKQVTRQVGKGSKEVFFKSINKELRNGGSKINREFWSKGGHASDRGGYSKAGRAWQKHGDRPDSIFPKAKGNPSQVNEGGQSILDNILNDPNSSFFYEEHSRFGYVFKASNSEKGSVQFSLNGKMIGLLEP